MELKLRTPLAIPPRIGILSHDRPILLLGSCFTDNIGRRLAQRGFNVVANPLGPVYNPLALARQAELIASGRAIKPDELFLHDGLWRHFLAHTLLARPDRAEAAEAINVALSRAREILLSPTPPLICLTLGTARTFFLADTEPARQLPVANCHKLPAARFDCRMISLDEASAALAQTISLLSPSPQSDVILTVSPIRYLAEGLDVNSLSKATLRLAAANAVAAHDAIYFPAFEAITDDLRDYRFYNPDMIHPTEQAADYVYDLFEEAYADPHTRVRAREALQAFRRQAHRPLLNPDRQNPSL